MREAWGSLDIKMWIEVAADYEINGARMADLRQGLADEDYFYEKDGVLWLSEKWPLR